MMRSEKGTVLIGATLITLMIMVAMIQYGSVVTQMGRSNVRVIGSQKARINADSGLQAGMKFLRSPESGTLRPGVPYRLPVTADTMYRVELIRDPFNNNLVSMHATGYYNMNPDTGAISRGSSSQASTYAKVMLRNVGDYFAALPGTLTISYGSNISNGIVYARDLVFQGPTPGPKTIIKSAYYLNSIEPPSPAVLNTVVTFIDGPPIRYTTEPTLPQLDPGIRQQYQTIAGAVTAADTVLSGNLIPPVSKTIFVAGNVTLGEAGTPLTATGPVLIYSQGDIVIENNVTGTGAGWVALMAEGNIFIKDTAPNNLTIQATMVTNGRVKAQGDPKNTGVLQITGGIVSWEPIELSDVYLLQRIYAYQAPDTTLPLPFLTETVAYRVTRGRYLQ